MKIEVRKGSARTPIPQTQEGVVYQTNLMHACPHCKGLSPRVVRKIKTAEGEITQHETNCQKCGYLPLA